MQVAAFIFIQRKWEEDKNHFGNMLDYFCDIHEPLQLLIFPEGTDLTGTSVLPNLMLHNAFKTFTGNTISSLNYSIPYQKRILPFNPEQ